MSTASVSKSAAVRARLNHPVIDSDGHMIEFEPGFVDYLKKVGGPSMVDRFYSDERNTGSWGKLSRWYSLSPEERQSHRQTRAPWWALPTKNTLDRATAVLPKLLHERMDDIGLDFTVLYPSLGLSFPHTEDAEIRQATCRALNMFCADYFREYADRMTPAACIPMHTPQEAVAELEYVIKELGLKAVMMAGHVQRPIPAAASKDPDALFNYAFWLDNFCIDSAYDYDPVWAKCVELKVPPTFHSPAMGWGGRTTSNYMYNHTGHFAAAGEVVCKALLFGGVTRRFPTLKFGFLESGVGWASDLYAGIIARWKKRNPQGMENYNPANLNKELWVELHRRYGGQMVQENLDALNKRSLLDGTKEDPATLDDWRQCQIEKAEDIRDLFVPNFYFGCEADDPLNATAFNSKMNPFGARLRAIFSSDIGHWDVPDMTEVLEEAYELVEDGLLTEEDFRDFVFTNPVTLWTGMNPDFFKGTVVEKAAAQLVTKGDH